MATTEMQNVKIYGDDYERARNIRLDRGLSIVESIGCALEGWEKLPRKVQDELIRDRSRRQHAEPTASH